VTSSQTIKTVPTLCVALLGSVFKQSNCLSRYCRWGFVFLKARPTARSLRPSGRSRDRTTISRFSVGVFLDPRATSKLVLKIHVAMQVYREVLLDSNFKNFRQNAALPFPSKCRQILLPSYPNTVQPRRSTCSPFCRSQQSSCRHANLLPSR